MATAGAPVDTLAVLETNAGEGATITVRAGATREAATSSPSYQRGPLPFRASPALPQRMGYHSLVRLPVAQSFPFWQVEIAGTFPGDIFAATYATLGLARRSKNFSADMTETPTDAGTLERDRSGIPSRVLGVRGRTVDFDLSRMSPADFETQYADLSRLVGHTELVLVVPNSKSGPFLHDRILLGNISAARSTRPYSASFNQSFSIDSLI